jgi:hypothetical protein
MVELEIEPSPYRMVRLVKMVRRLLVKKHRLRRLLVKKPRVRKLLVKKNLPIKSTFDSSPVLGEICSRIFTNSVLRFFVDIVDIR